MASSSSCTLRSPILPALALACLWLVSRSAAQRYSGAAERTRPCEAHRAGSRSNSSAAEVKLVGNSPTLSRGLLPSPHRLPHQSGYLGSRPGRLAVCLCAGDPPRQRPGECSGILGCIQSHLTLGLLSDGLR